MNDYNLFVKTLFNYHECCIRYDFPVNILNPILVQVEFLLGELNYSEEDIRVRLNRMCNRIEKISEGDVHLKAFLMYSIVLNISEKHDYFIEYKDMVISASTETSNIPEQADKSEYWLTAWSPLRVANNPDLFIEKIVESKEMWKSQSEILFKALYNIIFQPPYDVTNNWGVLRAATSTNFTQ